MSKLIPLAVALVLLVPSTASAGSRYRLYLDGYCYEDADTDGAFILGGTMDIGTRIEEVTQLVIWWREFRDYGGDNWAEYNSVRDRGRRAVIGEDDEGWFRFSSTYETRFHASSYDVILDVWTKWRGKDGTVYRQRINRAGDKMDGGPCRSFDVDFAPG